ncbi:MAG TPA: superoxide dismutase family protein, partial [Virgibacillus sp.]|nr:superoxide dismutase family protein [Virgibacillus sp.]
MRLSIVVLLSLLAACNTSHQTAREIDMYNVSGDLVGTAVYTEQPEGVQLKIKVEGLSPGFHGVHIHEYAKCEGPDFKSAGNHLNPEGKEHGLMHPEGAHLGDLQNVEADSAGLVDVELTAADAT